MADAIISVVLNRLVALTEEQICKHVNLVRGVEKEILELSDELNTVRNVLDDAERKGYKDRSVKDWLRRLEDTCYEMDDVLDEWNISITLKLQKTEQSNAAGADVLPKQKVRSFITSPRLFFKKVITRHDIALKIKEVKGRLDIILAEKDRFGFVSCQPIDPSSEPRRVQSTSLFNVEEVCGRNFESEDLVRKLIVGSKGEGLGVSVLSIVGSGGVGKTTLAKLAYTDSRVKNCFELRIWICVSDCFDEVEIANGIIEKAGGSKPNSNQLDMLLHCLRECISGKKVLLVLDDVWTEDDTKWEPLKNSLKCGGSGSKILVTTRNERVALMMGTFHDEIHHLGHLTHEESWLLLGRIALFGKNKEECEKFQDIGKSIAKKCKGLPLAAKTMGSLLRFKDTLEEWENVLNSEIWELEEVEVDLFPHLLLSYNELSPTLKRCFSYCAVFPKDTEINVKSLITKWMALGYLGANGDWEVRGREYFDKLAMRSLFQDFEKGNLDEETNSFKIHDIVHDFAQFLRKNVGSKRKKTTCQACSPLLVSHVKVYRSLYHYKDNLPYDADPHFCDGLTSVRVLSLRDCRLRGIPKEVEKLIHLRWLDLGENKFPNKDDLKGIFKLYNLQFLWLDKCKLQEIPSEIGNLIHMIQLDLSYNDLLKELPESLCNLGELERLNVNYCSGLARLPQGIHRLVNLKHLCNIDTYNMNQYPQGLGQLTTLVTLPQFHGSKLGLLKNLNRLSSRLDLRIKISSGDSEEEVAVVVEDARDAELVKKTRIQELTINFEESTTMGGEEMKESVWNDVLDALEPHPKLQNLSIWDYKGSRLPRWITSPLNQLRSIYLIHCNYLSLMPPLGKLPLLETFFIRTSSELEVVGREFLGITTTTTATSSFSSGTIGFPKLRELSFYNCSKWKEWEDITEEEEEDSVAVILMPCLTELTVIDCNGLTELPHRLLRKVSSSLKVLTIYGSTQLEQVYGDKEGEAWRSISRQNPHLDLIHHD